MTGGAYVVWLHSIGGPKLEIRYCRLPEGASDCSAASGFASDPAAAHNDWSEPLVLAEPGERVVIVSGFCCSHVMAFVSNDGGTTFAAAKEVVPVVPREPPEAAAGPGPDEISLLGSSVRSAASVAYRLQGTIRRAGKAGANPLAFAGRIGSRTLPPGRYRAAIVATDAAGNRSRVQRLSFTVLRRSQKATRR